MNPPRISTFLGPSPISYASASIGTEATASAAANVVDHSTQPATAIVNGLVVPSGRFYQIKFWMQCQVGSSQSELGPRCRQH